MRHSKIKNEISVSPGHRCIGVGVNMLIIIVMAAAAVASTDYTELSQPGDDVESVLFDHADSGTVTEDANLSGNGGSFDDQPVQSISFVKDMSIKDALRFLAARYRKNIIPSSQVGGKLGITNLYGVTFEEALNAILGHDYRCEIDGNFIRVYTAQEYAQFVKDKTRMTTRVYELYYVNAAEIKALIAPILSESGQIASTSASAVNTEAGEGGDTPTMRDTVVVFDFPERLDEIAGMIKEVDVKPQQILIEVTILSAELSETTQFGIEWDKIVGIGSVTRTTTPLDMSISLASAATTGLAMGYTNNAIVASITALEGVTDTTVLANPKIMALNKQAGYINIGEERGYTASTTQGQTTTTSVDFLVSGTILKFRPFICDDGYIRMEISPELSTGSLQDVNSTLPLKTVTQVKSNIMVKDGKTIIIGGLFKEKLINTDSQVPVIGDIPIIGRLFKSTKDENIRTELIILITPHIIDKPEEFASVFDERQRDISRIVEGSRKRMSPLARARIYEEKYAKAVKYYSEKNYDKALRELDWIIDFRPNALEAIRLKEKILAEVQPDKYRELERVKLNEVRRKQDIMWKRR